MNDGTHPAATFLSDILLGGAVGYFWLAELELTLKIIGLLGVTAIVLIRVYIAIQDARAARHRANLVEREDAEDQRE